MKQDIHELGVWLKKTRQRDVARDHMYGEWQLEEAASEARIKLAERQAAAVALAKFTTLTPEEDQLFQQAEELAAQGREGIRFERWLDKRMSDSFGE